MEQEKEEEEGVAHEWRLKISSRKHAETCAFFSRGFSRSLFQILMKVQKEDNDQKKKKNLTFYYVSWPAAKTPPPPGKWLTRAFRIITQATDANRMKNCTFRNALDVL